MSLESWSTIASLGTFLVIAATAIVALVQLRHSRSSNQIMAITEMRETLESERFTLARRYLFEQLPKMLADPAQRSKLRDEVLPVEFIAARDVANFFEAMGAFVKLGIVDKTLVIDLWDGVIFRAWKKLEPIVLIRREVEAAGLWSSFEYLAMLCEESLARNRGDNYPRGMRRMTFDRSSLEALETFRNERAEASPNSQAWRS